MLVQTARQLTMMTREGYEGTAEEFNQSRRQNWDDFTVFDSLVKDGHSVLDIGCGNGRLFSSLSRKIISYVGIDRSPKLVEYAKEKYRMHQYAPQFATGDFLMMDNIPEINGKKFNIVFMIASLHHIPQRQHALDALTQVRNFLVPGGLLCLENWNLWRLEKGQKTVWGAMRRRLSSQPLAWEKRYGISRFELGIHDVVTEWKGGDKRGFLYYHAYTVRELRALLSEAGYRIAQCYYIRDGARARWWNGKNIMTIAC